MDKYNELALSTIKYLIYKESLSDTNRIDKVLGMKDDNIVIKQDYNYTIDTYYLVFVATNIASVTFDKKQYMPEIRQEFDSTPCIFIPLSYAKHVDSLVVEITGGIVDPISIHIDYQDADKQKYDLEQQEELNKNINLALTRGLDLINVFWDEVSENVDHVEISIYKMSDMYNRGDRLVVKFVEKGASFKSITGLGFADYRCEIVEYDKENKVLAKQDATCRLAR